MITCVLSDHPLPEWVLYHTRCREHCCLGFQSCLHSPNSDVRNERSHTHVYQNYLWNKQKEKEWHKNRTAKSGHRPIYTIVAFGEIFLPFWNYSFECKIQNGTTVNRVAISCTNRLLFCSILWTYLWALSWSGGSSRAGQQFLAWRTVYLSRWGWLSSSTEHAASEGMHMEQ